MKVSSADDQGQLVTVREGATRDRRQRLLHQYRIEKLLVVDDAYPLHRPDHRQGHREGQQVPRRRKARKAACAPPRDRRRRDGLRRAQLLIDAEIDMIVVDTRTAFARRA